MLYFESLGAQLKDMDLFVFLRIVDVYRSNVITYKKFLKSLNKILNTPHVDINLDIEIRRFK